MTDVDAAETVTGGAVGFTPGPWELREMGYGYDLARRGVSGERGSYGGWFVELHSGMRDYDPAEFHETFEANARLIAAAPDLLEALTLTIARMEALRVCDDSYWDDIAKIIRAAVAKATATPPQSADPATPSTAGEHQAR